MILLLFKKDLFFIIIINVENRSGLILCGTCDTLFQEYLLNKKFKRT